MFVVILRNHGMTINIPWPFHSPVAFSFLLKTAGVADEIVHLAVFVFACRYAVNFAAVHPNHCLAGAGGAIAVRIHRVEEPHATLETESAISQCPHRTNVNHVAAEFTVD